MNEIQTEFTTLINEKHPELKCFLLEGSHCLKIDSPNDNLGSLNAYIDNGQIMLSVNSFHTHIDSRLVLAESSPSIAAHAIYLIEKIISGYYYFNEIYVSGRRQSSGAGPQPMNPEQKAKLKKIFGDEACLYEWNWFGPI